MPDTFKNQLKIRFRMSVCIVVRVLVKSMLFKKLLVNWRKGVGLSSRGKLPFLECQAHPDAQVLYSMCKGPEAGNIW